MENVFNLKRFGNLFNKHLREHLRGYLMSLIVFGAIILAVFGFLIKTGNFGLPSLTISHQFIVFMFSYLLGMFIFTASIFSDYNHSRAAFTSTMLPASIFEKYLLYWLISLAGFAILALGVYHLAQSIIIEYLKTQGIETIRFTAWNIYNMSPSFKWMAIMYLTLHSMAFLGAITFRKKTVIVTALATVLIYAAYLFLNYKVSLSALNGNSIPLPFVKASISTIDGLAEIDQSKNNELWAIISLGSVIILFWICAYFKLKEREI